MHFLNKNLFYCYLFNLTFQNDIYLISNPKNKFGLIWSCILKVMNFLIFRDFSIFFLFFKNLFRFILH